MEIDARKLDGLKRKTILNKPNTSSPRKSYSKEVRLEAIQYFAKLLKANSVNTVKSKSFLEKLVAVSVSIKQSLF